MQSPLSIRFIGHATCEIRCGDIAVVTDPYYRRWLGIHRRQQHLDAEQVFLTKPTAVVLSNTGDGHMDPRSFKFYSSRIPVILPPCTADELYGLIGNPLVEVAHWVPHQVCEGLTITPLPVRQYGARLHGLRGRYASAYIIHIGQHTVYFSGSSNFGTHYRECGNTYDIDVAILPIQAKWIPYAPLHNALNAEEFWDAAKDLRCRHAIPIRWGTFSRSAVGARCVQAIQDDAGSAQLRVLQPGGGATELHLDSA